MRWKKKYPRDLQSPTIQNNLNRYLRAGCIVSIDSERGVCDVRWFDRPSVRKDVLLTQANDKDWYIPEVGAYVIVGFDSKEQARILRYISRGHADRIKTQHTLPKLKPGESIREVSGTIFYMKNNGDVVVLTPDQNKIQLEASTGTFITDTINIRSISEGSNFFSGLVKRMITSLGNKTLQYIKNSSNKYLTEYKLKISEIADSVVGNTEDPIIDISAGNVVDDEGNPIDSNDQTVSADSTDALCLDVVIQKNSVEVVTLKVSKSGNIYLNTGQSITINSGTKGAARLDDEVEVTIKSSDIAGLGLQAGGNAVTESTSTDVTVKGKITAASSILKVG